MSEIIAGQTIAYRKGTVGREVGMVVETVERVSETTIYVYGRKARVSDGAPSTAKLSALLGVRATWRVID